VTDPSAWIQGNEKEKQRCNKKTLVAGFMALSLVAPISAFGASGDKEVKGMITGWTWDTLIVKAAEGQVTVVLSDGTTTKDDRGLLSPVAEDGTGYLTWRLI
jgi:hypothetical protein